MTTRARAVVLVVALALAASLLTLAVVLAKPAQAQAQTSTDTYQDTFNFYTTSSCTGEVVFIEGTLHTVSHTTIDTNGMYHATDQYHLQGQGEGLDSGDKYFYDDTFSGHANFTGALDQTFTETFKLTRLGSASATDDYNVKAVIHVTVNANGEVTATVENVEFVCT